MVAYASGDELDPDKVRSGLCINRSTLSVMRRLLDMPSFKLANSLYDQSFSEVLAFRNAEPDATTLRT